MWRVGPSRSGEWQDWLEKSASGTGTLRIYSLEKSFLLPAVRRVDWRWQLWLRPWRLFSVLQVRIEDSLNSDRTVGMYMDKSDICKVVCGKWMREKRRNSRTGPGFCLTQIEVEREEEQVLDLVHISWNIHMRSLSYVLLDVKIYTWEWDGMLWTWESSDDDWSHRNSKNAVGRAEV